jgi:hypothetical protein
MSPASNPASSATTVTENTRGGSVRLSRSLRRAFAIIGIGLVNFVLIVGLLASLLPPERTSRWDWYRFELHRSVVAAVAYAPLLLLGMWAVLARERWILRAFAAFIGLVFWVLALMCQFWGVGGVSGDSLAFWFTLVVLIPFGSWFGLAIAWEGEKIALVRTAQFRIADFLGWIAAIAATLSFVRLFVGSEFFSDYGQRVLRESATTFAASAVVAVPCLRLAYKRERHVGDYFPLFAWILFCSAIFLAGYLPVAYFTAQWWFSAAFKSIQLLVYLLVLAVALLANIWALQWAGLRWYSANRTSASATSPTP